MRDEVALLEAKYEELCAIAATNAAPSSSHALVHSAIDAPVTVRSVLLDKYTQARDEMRALRSQIAAMKARLVEFDLFSSALESYTSEFAATPVLTDPLLQEPPEAFEPLTDETCYAIIQTCYQQIFAPQWRGTRFSTGASLFGWRDERFVDDTTLQFALTKSFATLGLDHLMHTTWAIVTTPEHMHTIQKTTIGVKVLQVINDDIVVTQRCVNHPQLQRVVCVNMLMFRLRTERGYVVAYVTIDHPSPPSSPRSSSDTQRRSSARRPTYVDIDKFTNGDGDGKGGGAEKPSVAWVDTLQYFIFEEEEAYEPQVQDAGDDDDMVMDDELIGFAASLIDDTEAQLSPPAALLPTSPTEFPTSPRGCRPPPSVRVTYGGRMSIKDPHYASYFLVEVLSMIVRWDQAVAYSSLMFSVTDTDARASDTTTTPSCSSSSPSLSAHSPGWDSSEACTSSPVPQ